MKIKPRDMRNLTRRKGGWWLEIRINKKRIREYAGPTEARARAYRDDLKAWARANKRGGNLPKPEGEPLEFDSFAKDFLTLYAKQKRSYERDKRSIALLKKFFSGFKLKDINAEAVDRYRAGRKGVSVATSNRELACLRKMLYLAVEYGKLASYPLPTKGLLKAEPEYEPRILTLEEAERLIEVADPAVLRDTLIIYLGTGLRKRELLGLSRKNVDFKRGELTITGDRAKNGKSRTIPLGPQVLEVLRSRPGREFFFENPTTGKPVRSIEAAWATAKARAEIKGRLRIHDMRDTFATWRLRAGVDIRTVAELIGDSPEVALKRYCHSDERTKRAAVQGMPIFGVESGHKVPSKALDEAATTLELVH